MFGRITRLLVSACVVPAGLGLSILQTQAAAMPGLFWKDSSCSDNTYQSSAESECNCPHCREANSSDSRLLRFFKSRCTKTKWAERTPKRSWKYYHPCPPYFQPTFGIHQTSWNILPHDECHIPFAEPPVYSDDLSPSGTELLPSQPPVTPEAPNEAMQHPVMPMATETSAGDFERNVGEKVGFPATQISKKSERRRALLLKESVSRDDTQGQDSNPTEMPSWRPANERMKPKPLHNIPARPSPKAIVLPGGLEFDARTLDSVFAPQNEPFFPTQPAASGVSATSSPESD